MNDDFNKTKPINTIDDLSKLNATPEETKVVGSREEKYKETILKEEEKAAEEAAEEALAEKNIAEAESLLEQEKEALEDVDPDKVEEEEVYVSDKKGIAKLIDNFKHLPKEKKIIYGVIAGLILLLVILVIVALVILLGGKKKPASEPTPEETVVEQAPVIVSNYYYKDGVLHFVNEDEEEIGEYECQNQDESLCFVAQNKHRDNFDVPHLVKEDGSAIVRVLPIYEDNYVFVFDNKSASDRNIILYSMSDKSNMATYLDVKGYNDDYVIVADSSNKYGLIQFKDGVQELIKPQYSYLGMIDGESNLVAKSAKGYLLINTSNKIQSKAISGNSDVKFYNDYLIVTATGSDYALYNYNGELLSKGNTFVTVKGKFAALVNDSKVIMMDSDGLKYNEEGISLKNSEYVKTYIYDENDALKETKKSFTIEEKNTSIGLAVFDGDKDEYTYLDKATAKVNKKYEYVNYFEGKIYFYKDANKTELAGSYSCGLKNEVSDENGEFTSCFIAKNSVFEDNDSMTVGAENMISYIPIINGKYAFVKDTDSIYLYDISANKSLGSYNSIDIYMNDNDNVSTYSGDINIEALNKKGLYGMIRLSSNAATPVYAFAYNKIEKVKDIYIGLNTNDKWVVLSGDTSVTYDEKIQGYNSNKMYYKTKGTSYHVYDEYGNKVSKDDFEYVELYTDFYAGVKNKEVFIYDYDGNQISTKGVKVSNTDYVRVSNPSFYAKRTDGKYYVYVYDGKEYTMNPTFETEVHGGSQKPEPEPQNP